MTFNQRIPGIGDVNLERLRERRREPAFFAWSSLRASEYRDLLGMSNEPRFFAWHALKSGEDRDLLGTSNEPRRQREDKEKSLRTTCDHHYVIDETNWNYLQLQDPVVNRHREKLRRIQMSGRSVRNRREHQRRSMDRQKWKCDYTSGVDRKWHRGRHDHILVSNIWWASREAEEDRARIRAVASQVIDQGVRDIDREDAELLAEWNMLLGY